MHRSLFRTGAPAAIELLLACGSASAATLTPIALTGYGDVLGPGVEDGTTFLDLSPPTVDALGYLVFFAHVEGASVPVGADRGVWRHAAPLNEVIVREGSLSPFDGAPISFLLNNPNAGAGNVVAESFEEILIYEDALLDTLAHYSEQAVGLPAGVFYGAPGGTVTDSNDVYAFGATLSGAIAAGEEPAVFAGDKDALMLVAQGGMSAPGTATTYSGFPTISLSPDGGLALYATLNDNGQGVWVGDASGVSLHVRNGDAAPGMPAGNTFSFISGVSSVDNSGSVIFEAFTGGGGVTNGANEGVWAGAPGALQLIIREGTQAAGLPAGVNYASQSVEGAPPQMNAAGDVAHVTRLIGSGVNFTNWTAIVAGKPGALQLVARTGDAAPNAPGMTFQNVSNVALSETGHVAFLANIWDGVLAEAAMYAWHESTGLELIARKGDVVDFGMGGMHTIDNISFAPGAIAGVRSGLGKNGTLAFVVNLMGATRGIVSYALAGGSPADFNGDGMVDGMDLAALLATWGACGPPCPTDLNGDGMVDGMDLAALLAAWS
jgi:hypothetical protein